MTKPPLPFWRRSSGRRKEDAREWNENCVSISAIYRTSVARKNCTN